MRSRLARSPAARERSTGVGNHRVGVAPRLLLTGVMLRPAVVPRAGNTPTPRTGGIDASRLATYGRLLQAVSIRLHTQTGTRCQVPGGRVAGCCVQVPMYRGAEYR